MCLKSHNVSSNDIASNIKCFTGLNMYGDRIKLICKRNGNEDCQMCNENKSWEHVTLCDKQKKKREECLKTLKQNLTLFFKEKTGDST